VLQEQICADGDSDAENDCHTHCEDEDIAHVKSKTMKDGQAALNAVRQVAFAILLLSVSRHGKALPPGMHTQQNASPLRLVP
jgi:hypothetical protein